MALSASFANEMAPGFLDIVGTTLRNWPAFYSRFFNVQTSEHQYEDYLHATGIPKAVPRDEGEPTPFFDPLEGGTKRFTHDEWAIGVQISHEAWADDRYKAKSALRKAARSLARAMAERVEVQAADVFDNGDTSYPTIDGPTNNALFGYNTHPRLDGGGYQSNAPQTALALSVSSYRAARLAFRKWTDDVGNKVMFRPVRLIVPDDLEYTAMEIIQSPNRPDTSDRVINVTANSIEIATWSYLTNQQAWGLQADDHPLVFFWRERPTMDAYDDRNTRMSKFASFMRFSYGPVWFLGIWRSPGA